MTVMLCLPYTRILVLPVEVLKSQAYFTKLSMSITSSFWFVSEYLLRFLMIDTYWYYIYVTIIAKLICNLHAKEPQKWKDYNMSRTRGKSTTEKQEHEKSLEK